jgi:hypothetical protein
LQNEKINNQRELYTQYCEDGEIKLGEMHPSQNNVRMGEMPSSQTL